MCKTYGVHLCRKDRKEPSGGAALVRCSFRVLQMWICYYRLHRDGNTSKKQWTHRFEKNLFFYSTSPNKNSQKNRMVERKERLQVLYEEEENKKRRRPAMVAMAVTAHPPLWLTFARHTSLCSPTTKPSRRTTMMCVILVCRTWKKRTRR